MHPGIIPIHDVGCLPDGRPCYTMKEVRGDTLEARIQDLHRGRPAASLRRLVHAFAQVCEAVGYAHQRGVLHRDLKPQNIMLGEHGEVLVLHWGLARVLGAPEADAEAVETARSAAGARSQAGRVTGTPA